jgi:hypothetical protein
VADSACVSSGSRPSSSEVCLTGVACGCGVGGQCGGANALCDSRTQSCVCSRGWTGASCLIPDLGVSTGSGSNSSDPGRQCAGVVDTSGACCVGPIDVVSGLCCGVNDTVAASGRCCEGVVDGCGVCGGDGVAVDVSGRCCSTALSPSNVCCGSGGSDSCGVCSGLNACAAIVRMLVSDTEGMLCAVLDVLIACCCVMCCLCICVSVSNVTLFLRSALGVDASLLFNVSLTSTGTAGTVRHLRVWQCRVQLLCVCCRTVGCDNVQFLPFDRWCLSLRYHLKRGCRTGYC